MWTSRRTKAFFVVLALFLVQNALGGIFPAGTVPPLLVIGVVYFALTEGPAFGLVIGAFAGLFPELYATGRLGAPVAGMALVGLACGALSSRLFPDGLVTQIFLPAASLVLLSALSAAAYDGPAFSGGEVVFAALLSPFLFAAMKKVAGGR